LPRPSARRWISPTIVGKGAWSLVRSQDTICDRLADTGGLGYEGGALVFGAGSATLVAAYNWTNISRATLFRAAFIIGYIMVLSQRTETHPGYI
jgi:hypothetical protein